MSYDLYIFPSNEFDHLVDYHNFFEERKSYSEPECTNQYFYKNDDTGVYFSFNWIDEDCGHENFATMNEGRPFIAFNLNFFRPGYFGLEASHELTTLISSMEARIFDPQIEGMDGSSFSVEGFLKGYDYGNHFAYNAIRQREDINPETVPKERNQEIWKWNYHSETLESSLNIDLFVPKVFFFETEAGLKSAIIHGRNIPSIVPSFIDGVIVGDQDHRNQIHGFIDRKELLRMMKSEFISQAGNVFTFVGEAKDEKFWLWAEVNAVSVISKFESSEILDAEPFISE